MTQGSSETFPGATGAHVCVGHYLRSVTHQASGNEAKKSPPLSSSPLNGDRQLLRFLEIPQALITACSTNRLPL